jgi:hypothetical protein
MNNNEIYDKYDKYIFEHRQNVYKSYRWLVDKGIIVHRNILEWNIRDHDMSKYNMKEFEPYAKYFYGEEITPEIEKAFDFAWNHHQKSNPHHWEYWLMFKDSGEIKVLEMPYEYIVEMICDWWAFSWKKGNLKEIFSWYEANKNIMLLHENTRKQVEELLNKIEESLEEVKVNEVP